MKRWIAGCVLLVLLATFAGSAFGVNAQRIIPLNLDGDTADTTSVGTADSTGIIGVGDYERLSLWLKPNKPCKVAIQIRVHGVLDTAFVALSDTNNTAVWPWRTFTLANAVVAAESLVLSQTILPTAVQAGGSELTVYFPEIGVTKWGHARAILIPLRDSEGDWVHGRHISIRLRVLTAYGANAVVTWSAALHGVQY